MLKPDSAKVRRGPDAAATPGSPNTEQLLSTCRHLANRPSFEVQAKLGKLSCLEHVAVSGRKGSVEAPSLLPQSLGAAASFPTE